MKKTLFLTLAVCLLVIFSSCTKKEYIYRDYYHTYPMNSYIYTIPANAWEDDGYALYFLKEIPQLTDNVFKTGKVEVYIEDHDASGIRSVFPLPDIFTDIETLDDGTEKYNTRFIRFELHRSDTPNGYNMIKFIEETTDLRYIDPSDRVTRTFRVVITEAL